MSSPDFCATDRYLENQFGWPIEWKDPRVTFDEVEMIAISPSHDSSVSTQTTSFTVTMRPRSGSRRRTFLDTFNFLSAGEQGHACWCWCPDHWLHGVAFVVVG